MPFVDISGVNIAYSLTGPDDGPAALLVHDWTGGMREWRNTIPALNDAGWRTLAIDMPGHDASDVLTDRAAYKMAALAELHYEAAISLNCVPAVLIGFSMGSAIVDEYLIRHPDAVTAAVALGGAGGDWVDAEAPADIAESDPFVFESGIGAHWGVRQKRLYAGEYAAMSEEEKTRRRSNWSRTSSEAYVYTLNGLVEKRNTLSALAALAKPMLFIHGENDEDSIIEADANAIDTIPESRLAVIPNAGHFAQDGNTPAFNHALLEFLAGFR